MNFKLNLRYLEQKCCLQRFRDHLDFDLLVSKPCFWASPRKTMQNHLEITSKSQFWIRNVRNWTKTLTSDTSGPRPARRTSPCQQSRLFLIFWIFRLPGATHRRVFCLDFPTKNFFFGLEKHMTLSKKLHLLIKMKRWDFWEKVNACFADKDLSSSTGLGRSGHVQIPTF